MDSRQIVRPTLIPSGNGSLKGSQCGSQKRDKFGVGDVGVDHRGLNKTIGPKLRAKKLIHRTTQGRWGLPIRDFVMVALDLIHP